MIDKLINQKIIIICGHYGSGKTNIAVNLAVGLNKSGRVTLVDLDVVNPFFRSADNIKELERLGIKCIAPQFANTNVDAPSVPPEIYSVFSGHEDSRAVIDLGGDAAGARVLGMFADKIKEYEMIYVVNKYRLMTAEPEQAVELARAIEANSRLKITSLINNSHIGGFTAEKDISASLGYAREISGELNVPELAVTAFIDADGVYKLNNYTRKF